MSLQLLSVSKICNGFSKPSTTTWTFVLNSHRLRPSASPPFFCAVAMLMIFSQAPPAKTGAHTFPRVIPLRQVLPGYFCVQPIQNSIEHCQIVFSGPSARLASLAATALSRYSVVLLSIRVASYLYVTAALLQQERQIYYGHRK